MRPLQARFVALCQQLLVLGAVLAVLTPAASVLTLDIVATHPGGDHRAGRPAPGVASYVASSTRAATVPAAPVDAVDTQYSLTPPAGRRCAAAPSR